MSVIQEAIKLMILCEVFVVAVFESLLFLLKIIENFKEIVIDYYEE